MPVPVPPRKKYSKLTDSQRFNRSIMSMYHDSMSNASLLSKRLGVPYSTVKRWVRTARDNQPIYKVQEHARIMRDAVFNRYQEPATSNLQSAEITRIKETEQYKLIDYDITRGNPLPAHKGQTYQIIMEGKSKGEKRYVTTHTYNNLEDALGESARLARRYKRFWKGRRQIVRVFIRK